MSHATRRVPVHPHPPTNRRRRAASRADTLACLAVGTVALAVLIPVLAAGRGQSAEALSAANLAQLNRAHTCYAADWGDRQFTALADDFGAAGGSCPAHISEFGCPGQLILGWDGSAVPSLWGYYLGCAGFPGNCGNIANYKPLDFDNSSYLGLWRLGNVNSIHWYVNDKFYDPAFYAVDDDPAYAVVKPFFSNPAEFPGTLPSPLPALVFSSYALSPAAMYNPEVLRRPSKGGFQNPNSFDEGYASPTVSQAAYPDLKTRLIEHNWIRNAPAPCNPNFVDPPGPWCTPYFFSHGVDAAPMTLFFDGSVRRFSTELAVESDARVLQHTGGIDGLWSRDTPFGDAGYFGDFSIDGTRTAHHVLTTDGILGRDTLR